MPAIPEEEVVSFVTKDQDPTAYPQTFETASWSGVSAIALGAFALVVTEFLPVGVLPEMSASFGVSEGAGGLAVTSTALVGAISAPVATLVIRRMDRRTVLLGLTVLLLVSSALSAVAPTFSVLVISRLLLGLAVGGFWAISLAVVTQLVPRARVHTASSLVLGAISVGSVISVPTGSLIAVNWDWRAAFWAGCALSAVVCILQVAALPRIPARHAVTHRDFISLFKSPKIVGILATILLVVGAQYSAYTFINPYLQYVTGVDGDMLYALLLGYGIFTVLGNFGGGALAGRSAYRTLLVALGAFVSSLTVMALLGSTTVAVIPALALWAAAWGAAPVLTQLWLLGAARKNHSIEAAQAVNTSVFQLSIGLGSCVGSVTVDSVGLQTTIWVAVAILLTSCAVAALTGRLTLSSRRAKTSKSEQPVGN